MTILDKPNFLMYCNGDENPLLDPSRDIFLDDDCNHDLVDSEESEAIRMDIANYIKRLRIEK
jgi:hypothetical protein